jgi:transcriptional regulator with XRE-family HTH domain
MRCHIEGFPERLKKLMDTLGLNQKEFADLVEITPAALSQLLNGLRDPAAVTLVKLNKKTGVSIDKLFGITKRNKHGKQ